MNTHLTFVSAASYQPGIVYSVLSQCYAGILDEPLRERLQQFDREVLLHPNAVGACTLISSTATATVGLVSYDPRQAPDLGIIGHNGILPPHRRRGYGAQQIQEVLRMLRTRGCVQARVSTSEHPFYAAARRMYEACGFCETGRTQTAAEDQYAIIQYERTLIA